MNVTKYQFNKLKQLEKTQPTIVIRDVLELVYLVDFLIKAGFIIIEDNIYRVKNFLTDKKCF